MPQNRPLVSYEIEALEILAGEREVKWGAWLGAACETLHSLGYCTHEYGGDITPAGRTALAKARGQDVA